MLLNCLGGLFNSKKNKNPDSDLEEKYKLLSLELQITKDRLKSSEGNLLFTEGALDLSLNRIKMLETSKKTETTMLTRNLDILTYKNKNLTNSLQLFQVKKLDEAVEIPEELVRCAVCLDDLRSSQAKVGSCGHSVCGRCASRLRESNCPMCRAPLAFLWPAKNFLLSDLLDHLKKDDPAFQEREASIFPEPQEFAEEDLADEEEQLQREGHKEIVELLENFCELAEKNREVRDFFCKLASKNIWLWRFWTAATNRRRDQMEAEIRRIRQAEISSIFLMEIDEDYSFQQFFGESW